MLDKMATRAHERPLVADQCDRFFRREPLFGSIAQLVQRAGVVVEAIIAKRTGVGKNELGAAFHGELPLAFS